MVLDLVLLIVGLFVLILGGDFLVRGASVIALRLHISPLVVGLTIVAFGTSAPELLISLNSVDYSNLDSPRYVFHIILKLHAIVLLAKREAGRMLV